MKRCAILIATVAFVLALGSATASSPFDQKLSTDQQIIHALNRLAFGPRPGDVEAVRKTGVAKWIEGQLHPEQIAENPELEARLKPLESIRLDLATVVKDYTPQPVAPAMMMAPAVATTTPESSAVRMILQTGTPEMGAAVLKAMEPDQRREALSGLPPNIDEKLPDEYKREAEEARRMRQEELQKQNRMRNPPLADLLNADQLAAFNSGNRDQMLAVYQYLDPDKRPQVLRLFGGNKFAEVPELRRQSEMQRSPRQVASEDAEEAKVFRAIYSNRQLEEVLVDFWFNHFNVDLNKVLQSPGIGTPNLMHLLIGSYERDAIRPHVFGHFRDLLLATARHPAMLYYLDNWESVAPGAFEVGPFAPRRGTFNGIPNSLLPGPLGQIAHGLNENYGREVMELHTLGVKAGYTQEDVINVARCFTGWTVRSPEEPEFVFAPFMHDVDEKNVLGHKIPAGRGEQDGLDVIDILARQPATAKFISRELAQRFVADDPPEALVDRMAQTFQKSDGDLRAVMETMFTSPEFFSEGAWESKIKSPFEAVVSAARALGGDVTDAYALVQKISDLGEPIYGKLAPTGYPNTGDTWLSSQGIMGRMTFSASIASGALAGVKPNTAAFEGKDAFAIAHQVLGRDPSPETQTALNQGTSGKDLSATLIASLVLGSPDFQRR